MQLVFKSDRSTWSLRTKYSSSTWETRFGAALQAPRRVAPMGASVGVHHSLGPKPLEDLANTIGKRALFLSWKHCDHNRQGRRFIRALVDELRKCGFAVWWDKTALTDVGEVNAYSASTKNELMHRLLRQGVLKSKCILAIWTENYGVASTKTAPNWTHDEWQTRRWAARIALVLEGIAPKKLGMAVPDHVLRISTSPGIDDVKRLTQRIKSAFEMSVP
jgi:hypothetical protein